MPPDSFLLYIGKVMHLHLELIAGHFGLILLALASSLRIPLVRGGTTNISLQKSSYALLFCASCCLSLLFFLKFRDSHVQIISLYELIFVLLLSWSLVLTLPKIKIHSYQLITIPLITCVLLVYLLREGSRSHFGESYQSTFLVCHIACAVSGEILAVFAAFLSILYLGQRQMLKKKNFVHLMAKAPALDLLDELLTVALAAGFLFLSIALISGVIFLVQNEGGTHRFLPKLIWSTLVWVWYFLAILLKISLKVPTRKVAQMGLLGFCFLVASYFGFIF